MPSLKNLLVTPDAQVALGHNGAAPPDISVRVEGLLCDTL